MRHTEFWARMDHALGEASAGTWAELYVMADLGSRTAQQALAAGTPPKQVWAAVHAALGLPENQR